MPSPLMDITSLPQDGRKKREFVLKTICLILLQIYYNTFKYICQVLLTQIIFINILADFREIYSIQQFTAFLIRIPSFLKNPLFSVSLIFIGSSSIFFISPISIIFIFNPQKREYKSYDFLKKS